MNKELFGVFGGIDAFERFRSREEFDELVVGPTMTVGLRDRGLDEPGWTDRFVGDDGVCAVWGEAYAPGESTQAQWLYERYAVDGDDALSSLNGSYLAVVDREDDEPFVGTDPVRSRECFYTDEPGVRVFGTDAAEVARTIQAPTMHRDGVLEFLHLGVTLGEKTWITGLSRLPIDSRLTRTSVEPLDRFVYGSRRRDGERVQEGKEGSDVVADLAARLSRAIDRRSNQPGRSGMLLSAGYDSRIVLSQVPDVERCYTVGSPSAQEVRGARRLAEQYDASHTALPPDERYLFADESKVRYSQGIKESLHIHHAGYVDDLDAETMYHGLLCDTFFRGHFTARDGVDVLGKRVPFGRLEPDPDPVESLLETFGYDREASLELTARTSTDVDPEVFVRNAIAEELASHRWRADRVQNLLTCTGIANQPSIPFHTQLADQFFAPFLATDRELLEWHLRTPPASRTTKTFLQACELIDDEILRHRPPDRPHDHVLLNELERFTRRHLPGLRPFEPPWPDRITLFERHDLDRRLFPGQDHIYPLAPRHKLRLNDVQTWVDSWRESTADSPVSLHAPKLTIE